MEGDKGPKEDEPKLKEEEEEEEKEVQEDEKNRMRTKRKVGRLQRVAESLFEPVDNSSLVTFRILWGLIIAYEFWTFIANDYQKATAYFIMPTFFFKYEHFEWVTMMEPDLFKVYLWSMLTVSLCISIGFLYRLMSVVLFVGFFYLVHLDAALYLNHFYLIEVLSFFMIFLPAHHDLSIDAFFIFPSIRSKSMPQWVLVLLRGIQSLVYFFAGIAKINEDWLRGEPLRHWVTGRRTTFEHPLITSIMDSAWMPYFLSYGGLYFDLFAGIFLLFKDGLLFRATLFQCIFFHVSNKLLFNIGVFPFLMIAFTILYFRPERPRQLLPFLFGRRDTPKVVRDRGLSSKEKVVIFLLVLIFLVNIFLPFRYLAYNGNVAWDEMGHKYSWRMKLRNKNCRLYMMAQGQNGEEHIVDVETYFVGKQHRKMKPVPELVIQFANHIADTTKPAFNGTRPKIFAELSCDLNYRGYQRMLNSSFDLASLKPYDWPYPPGVIVPLEPLTEKQQALFPWNFEWTFAWLKDPLAPGAREEKLPRPEPGPIEARYLMAKYQQRQRVSGK